MPHTSLLINRLALIAERKKGGKGRKYFGGEEKKGMGERELMIVLRRHLRRKGRGKKKGAGKKGGKIS